MPITTTPFSANFFCTSVTRGMAAMHGPHHVAQHSSTYTLPFSNRSTGSPFTQAPTAKAGAGSPARSFARAAAAAAAAAAAVDPIAAHSINAQNCFTFTSPGTDSHAERHDRIPLAIA